MKTKVTGLGDIGLISDKDEHDLPINGWSSLNNIRCKRGRIEPMDGYEDMVPSPALPNAGTPAEDIYVHHLTSVATTTAFYWVFPFDADGDGFAEKIYYADTPGTSGNITRQVSAADVDYTDQDNWNVCQFNGLVILNNGSDNPQYWGGNTSVKCTALPYDDGVANPGTTYVWNAVGSEVECNTDDSTNDITNGLPGTANDYKAKVIRAFRNQLIALNITEGSNNYPQMIHWSHPADPGSVPITWDYRNDSYDAGRVDLAETNGWVLDALPLGDTLIVYKEDAIYRLSYVGGTFIYDRDTVTVSHGLYATNCAVDFGGTHFCVGDGVVYIHSGGEIKNILEGKNADVLFDSIDQDNYQRTFVVHNKSENECWICYPETGYAWANKVLIWNYSNNAWYTRDIPQSSTIKVGQPVAGTGISMWDNAGDTNDLDDAGYTAWNSTDPLETPWDATQWTTRDYSAIGDTLIAATNQLTKFGVGQTSDAVNATRTDILPDEVDTWFMMREIIPHAEGGSFSVQVGCQDMINATVAWSAAQTFTPGTTRKLDVRCTAPVFAVKFFGNNYWHINAYTVDVERAGTR